MKIELIDPSQYWKDYELIDCGDFEKLERWGKVVTSRPEPQAVWPKSLSANDWTQKADHIFKRDKNNPEKGVWTSKSQVPNQWFVEYNHDSLKLKFRLGLSAFKHVGLFPEQSYNWNYIYDNLVNVPNAKVLNLFAYTGGASLAAKAANADVTHVDSVKQVITWSKENMLASNLENIRWMVDDAFKFCQREERRGNKYNGIILDPPAYGRGPDGEKWVLEDMIYDLLLICRNLLAAENSFIIVNLYSMGFSPVVLNTLMRQVFGSQHEIEIGEMYFKDNSGKNLPLGIYARINN